jgi:hypothetical protein
MLFWSTAEVLFQMPAPLPKISVLFPLMVLLLILRVPELMMPPPQL